MSLASKSSQHLEQIGRLKDILEQLSDCLSLEKKLEYLKSLPEVKDCLKNTKGLKSWISTLSIDNQFVVASILAIGQGTIVFHGIEALQDAHKLDPLLRKLTEVQLFYDSIGGIIGYHLTILKLMDEEAKHGPTEKITYNKPLGLDISKSHAEVKEAIRWGIEAMRTIAEVYPVGGAGDRLNLRDKETGESLPAAQLQFCGVTLLEGLVRDLQGREFLYYKLFGKQLMTPIAMMTSDEKNNNQRLQSLCEQKGWFGRERESFFMFLQPLVPMITACGQWAMADVLKPYLKPCGHGAIWKVAKDRGVFAWLKKQHRTKIIVRQINNPVAATDGGLLVLAGLGAHGNKDFGFASCHRLLNVPEGVDVLKEVAGQDGYAYCITNIEYTEFKRCGIEDIPEKPGSPYSKFPSNTNVLFADLDVLDNLAEEHPLPGILLNMKNKVTCLIKGEKVEKLAGRLETTMQNIADWIVDISKIRLIGQELANLRTFLTYNERPKTISVVKQLYQPGNSIVGTPEGGFYDIMANYCDLLSNHCGIAMPEIQTPDQFIANGPDLVVRMHPALGGLYPVIAQKLRRGCIDKHSELILEIAEIEVVNLDLSGSLIIEAKDVMGKTDPRGIIIYDTENAGKCTLINVCIKNEGYGSTSVQEALRDEIQRKESLTITLEGNGEFFAENVELSGDMHFIVPNGHRLVVYHQGKELAWHFEKIAQATWRWEYTFDESNNVCLEKIKTHR